MKDGRRTWQPAAVGKPKTKRKGNDTMKQKTIKRVKANKVKRSVKTASAARKTARKVAVKRTGRSSRR